MGGTTECNRVVLITIDSLRRDCLDEMPTLRSLASEGVHFPQAVAHSNWTPLSFPSILGPDPVFVRSNDHDLGTPTLAEHLSNHGVETVGLNAANGFLTEHWGYDRGFDQFESFLDTNGRVSQWLATHPTTHGWVQLFGSALRRPFAPSDDRHTVDTSNLLDLEDRLCEVLRPTRGEQFVWAHLMDTHTPYVPAPQYLSDDAKPSVASQLLQQANASLGNILGTADISLLRDRYHGAARQIDRSLARIVTVLRDRGLADETCLVVAGDHGEEFLEHGHTAHYPKLYTELLEVPLVVHPPGGGGSTVEAPVGLEVIPATIADLFGLDPSPFEGASVRRVLEGDDVQRDGPVVSVTVRGESVTTQPIPRSPTDGSLLLSARDERWTYIYHDGTGERELYDRTTDPGEQDPLPPDEIAPSTIDRLHDAVQTRLDRIHTPTDQRDDHGENPPTSVTERLEHLGYS
ncbi:sulfatase-like hydrolase/transferase [Halorientalis pallida]|uniref:Sulfatase n=1 Tax=Halorientalis pallida TaxID=2479928 RepID=A0A498L0G7_9EURY|nr:sulfatase-like hydrolase/transferase [Halorientalis pallida]RXK47993.1 sulfatase [Halorientalis pallida]